VNQKVARLTLEKLKYAVGVAENGRIAVEMARKFPYDIICMDLSMPEMDGLEAAREIRKLEGDYGKTFLVAMTGHAIEEDREHFLEAGMDEFLTKPFDLFHLKETLLRARKSKGSTDGSVVIARNDRAGSRSALCALELGGVLLRACIPHLKSHTPPKYPALNETLDRSHFPGFGQCSRRRCGQTERRALCR
jgi:CheY-like chemotaxis protein